MPESNGLDLYPFFVTGLVVKGFGRGSAELGIPTANIDPEVVKNVSLTTGIYFGWSQLSLTDDQFNQLTEDQQEKLKPLLHRIGSKLVSQIFMSSTALGFNPFYHNKEKALETHILSRFDCDLYGVTMSTVICGKIRDEANYDTLEALIKAIKNDIEMTRTQLSLDPWKSLQSDERYFIPLASQ